MTDDFKAFLLQHQRETFPKERTVHRQKHAMPFVSTGVCVLASNRGSCPPPSGFLSRGKIFRACSIWIAAVCFFAVCRQSLRLLQFTRLRFRRHDHALLASLMDSQAADRYPFTLLASKVRGARFSHCSSKTCSAMIYLSGERKLQTKHDQETPDIGIRETPTRFAGNKSRSKPDGRMGQAPVRAPQPPAENTRYTPFSTPRPCTRT